MEFFTLAPVADIILFIVRVMLATVMLYFGVPKIRDLKQNAKDFTGMGFSPGWFWGTLVAAVEVFGALLLLLGAYVPLIAALFGFQMVVGTIWKISQKGKEFPDWSYDLLLVVLALVLLTFGSGFNPLV